MEGPEVKTENHSLVIPYTYVIFGKNNQMELTCEFEYSGNRDTSHMVEIKTMTGVDQGGASYDMSFLVEDSHSEVAQNIIVCIAKNHMGWDKGAGWWAN